jgi:hypothetical protein
MNLKNNMPESKKLLIRALELATDVLGRQHHFVAAIFNKVKYHPLSFSGNHILKIAFLHVTNACTKIL